MKSALMIIFCSVAMFFAGCASHDSHSKVLMMAAAFFAADSPDKAQILSRVSSVLGKASISCSVGQEIGASRWDILVPADKQAQAASLLKQDAAIHKYELTFVLAKDAHLVAREIFDGSATESSTVYVLLLPDDNPVVFGAFDSKQMEGVIKQCLPAGSILRIDIPRQLKKQPTEAQYQAFVAYCRRIGVSVPNDTIIE